jgi:hypothetical protein
MKSSHVAICACLVLLAICWCHEAPALPPPHPRLPDLENAPDILDIEVISVSKRFRLFASNFTIFRYKVEVVGNVTKVHKSASGLKMGSRITIRYDGYAYNSIPVPGPGPNAYPILDKGHAYKAYLVPDGNTRCVYGPFGNEPNYTMPFQPKQ